MANKTKLELAAKPILHELLRTWCLVVKHCSGNTWEKMSEQLFPDNPDCKDVAKRLFRWTNRESIPSFEELENAAEHAILNDWIPKNLNDSFLYAYKDFSLKPDISVSFFNLMNTVDLFDCFALNECNPQHLVILGAELRCLVHGPDDESSAELRNWLDLYKPFFLASEKQYMDDYLNLLVLMDKTDSLKRYGVTNSDEDLQGAACLANLRKSLLPWEKDRAAQTIRRDIAELMYRISSKTNKKYSNGEIAVFAGQPKGLGSLMATGEIIPPFAVYRNLELMAGFTLDERQGLVELSPFSGGRMPEFMEIAGDIDGVIKCYNDAKTDFKLN